MYPDFDGERVVGLLHGGDGGGGVGHADAVRDAARRHGDGRKQLKAEEEKCVNYYVDNTKYTACDSNNFASITHSNKEGPP